MDIRIGHGHDIHVFSPGRKLILGGVEFPDHHGLKGHSDADALVHAVMDAILGALAMGDIGFHFPDTDPEWKGASSMGMLTRVMQMARGVGFRVGNLDCMILCQTPRISPLRESIRASLAAAMGIEVSRVSVKAGTNEGCDAVGRGEALQCSAVVLMIAN